MRRAIALVSVAILAVFAGCAQILGVQKPKGDACKLGCLPDGSCGKCEGDRCEGDDECWSGRCQSGTCIPPSCTDNIFNGLESDVDCGDFADATCLGCTQGFHCFEDRNCDNKLKKLACVDNVCEPWVDACGDGKQGPGETDIDCGLHCGPCGDGKACFADTDCSSGVCSNGACGQAAPSCTDMTQNGDETGVDCGGSCLLCDGDTCTSSGDCASQNCVNTVCRPSTCSNTICQGSECGACATDDCTKNADCWSNNCEMLTMKCL